MNDDDGHRFGLSGWSGSRHHNTRVAEGYRFLWPLEDMAAHSLDAENSRLPADPRASSSAR